MTKQSDLNQEIKKCKSNKSLLNTWQRDDLTKLEDNIEKSTVWFCPVCNELNLSEEDFCFNCHTKQDLNESSNPSEKTEKEKIEKINVLLNQDLKAVDQVLAASQKVNSLLNKLIKKQNNEIYRIESNTTFIDKINNGINKFFLYFHYVDFIFLGLAAIFLVYCIYLLYSFDSFAWSHQNILDILYSYCMDRIPRFFNELFNLVMLFFNSAKYTKITINIQRLFINIFNKFPTA